MQKSNILIMAVTMMDFVTAMLILFYPKPLIVARLGIFYKIFADPYIGGLLMILAVFCAIYGLTLKNKLVRFILFSPQQVFLLMTTGSAIDFILMQHYADGVPRTWQFILQDQLPTIILLIAYTFSMIDLRKEINGQN